MISVTSHSHYIQKIEEGADAPDLAPALRPLCREHFRRIDRFIQLSLLGSGLCARGMSLAPACGLYVSSSLGPIRNNIDVQETVFKQHLLPKPFHFVNTLGSCAGFYVCKNLNLQGQGLFISRQGGAFEAVLVCAMADLELGIVKQALVGVVEESIFSLGEYRSSLNLPSGTPVAEGSHWVLLESGNSAQKTGELALSQGRAAAGKQDFSQGFHDSLSGASLTQFLSLKKKGSLTLDAAEGRLIVFKS